MRGKEVGHIVVEERQPSRTETLRVGPENGLFQLRTQASAPIIERVTLTAVRRGRCIS